MITVEFRHRMMPNVVVFRRECHQVPAVKDEVEIPTRDYRLAKVAIVRWGWLTDQPGQVAVIFFDWKDGGI